jgi:hypothetical protein
LLQSRPIEVHQHATGEEPAGQLAEFCSVIQDGLGLLVRLGGELGGVDLEVETLVALKPGEELRLGEARLRREQRELAQVQPWCR